MRSLIDIAELSVKEIDKLLDTANDIIENPQKYRKICDFMLTFVFWFVILNGQLVRKSHVKYWKVFYLKLLKNYYYIMIQKNK